MHCTIRILLETLLLIIYLIEIYSRRDATQCSVSPEIFYVIIPTDRQRRLSVWLNQTYSRRPSNRRDRLTDQWTDRFCRQYSQQFSQRRASLRSKGIQKPPVKNHLSNLNEFRRTPHPWNTAIPSSIVRQIIWLLFDWAEREISDWIN